MKTIYLIHNLLASILLSACSYTTFTAPDGTSASNLEVGTDIKGLSGLHLTDGSRSLSIDSLQSDQSAGLTASGEALGSIVGVALKTFVKP